jgi:hypothetical protein
MTKPGARDPATPSDPRVDAAWRALSCEEPPASLDAALLAAARREVGAKPQRSAARETVADRRRWWPLAAAATIAAILVGVLQLTTPDQLGAPSSDKAIVTDMPTPAATPAPVAPTTVPPANALKSEADEKFRSERAPPRADSPRPTSTLDARAPGQRETATRSVSNLAEPFPAAPPQPAVGAPAAPSPARQIGAAAPAAQGAASARPKEAPPSALAGSAAAERALPPFDAAAAGTIAATPAPALAPAAAPFAQRAAENASAPATTLAKKAAGHAADAGAGETRAKDRAPLPVAEWIALIRRLRDEGKSTEVAKELAAFRTAHADHEKLLPRDLRDWRPPEK